MTLKSELEEWTHPTFITNLVFTARDIYRGWTFQAGAYNLFASQARLPRDGAFNQYQRTVDYPSTLVLVSFSKNF